MEIRGSDPILLLVSTEISTHNWRERILHNALCETYSPQLLLLLQQLHRRSHAKFISRHRYKVAKSKTNLKSQKCRGSDLVIGSELIPVMDMKRLPFLRMDSAGVA